MLLNSEWDGSSSIPGLTSVICRVSVDGFWVDVVYCERLHCVVRRSKLPCVRPVAAECMEIVCMCVLGVCCGVCECVYDSCNACACGVCARVCVFSCTLLMVM